MINEENVSNDVEQENAEVEGVVETASEQEVSHEELHLLLEDSRNKADEHWNAYLRSQAELENINRRNVKELANAHKFAVEKFVAELLPVHDSMEMGVSAANEENTDISSLKEGMTLTLKMFADLMEKFNVQAINPEGEKFNPELHQAMSMQEVEGADSNTILTVVQKGYLLNDRLVRPAMVIVAK